MKIIQVIPSFAFGGAEIMCENLLYAQKRLGHDVSAVSLFDVHSPIAERIEAAGIKIFFMGKKPGLDLSMKKKLKKLFAAERPDVVHVHLNAIKYVAPAAKAAKLKKCIYTVHNLAEKDAGGFSQKLNAYFFRHSMAKPVALSPAVKESISRVYGICECNIPVVFNGIDLSGCTVKTDYSLGDSPVFLHVGRFFAQKNHVGMIRAFAKVCDKYPKARLRLVGDGEERGAAEELVRSLGLERNVTFEGLQSNVYPYLNSADIFLLPSLYEGVPITLIEAMGTALPIVATAVGGVPDMLRDGESAALCKCDTDAIAEACISLLESEALRESYGRAALEAASKFGAEHMAESYLKIYSEK